MKPVDFGLVIGLLAVLALLIVVVLRLRALGATGAQAAEMAWLRQTIAQQGESLAQIRERLAAAGEVSGVMQSNLGQARSLLERMTAQNEAQREAQERARDALARLEAVLIGSYSKGRAGENIVGETLRCFPPEMVQSDVALGGKRVEFALAMCDGRLLPIDSKWPATDLLQRLTDEEDAEKRAALCAEVEDQVLRRAREVAGYIDAERTLPWAVAAVPDAAFAACRRAQAQAHERGVIVVPYGMLIPYLLTLYHLHLRYATGADAAQTQSRLVEMARLLDSVERTLEGKLYRANTMLANACSECGQYLAAMRTCVTGALAASSAAEDAESASEQAGAGPHAA
jgi:DNA recombination protein RmuC